MIVQTFIIFILSIIQRSYSECEDYKNQVCFSNLVELCAMDSPNSLEDIYYARICLWKNQKDLDNACIDYLTVEHPSIIEPCFNDIESFCSSIEPGFGHVHSCLFARESELSNRCAQALVTESNTKIEESVDNIATYGLELINLQDDEPAGELYVSVISDNAESSFQRLIKVYQQIISVFLSEPVVLEDSFPQFDVYHQDGIPDDHIDTDGYEDIPDLTADSVDYNELSLSPIDVEELFSDNPISLSLLDDDDFDTASISLYSHSDPDDSSTLGTINSLESFIESLYSTSESIFQHWSER